MKTFKLSKLSFPVLILIVATSCKKTEVIPPTQENALPTDIQQSLPASMEQSSTNEAITYNYQTDIDLTAPGWYDINSCTGGQLHILSGIWHFDIHGMYSNHAVLMSIHNNTQNYKLVSLETGIEYTGSSTWNGHLNFPASNPYSFTGAITNSVILTASGRGNNSELKYDFHVAVDPNGNLTAWVDNFRAGCQ